MGLGLDGVKLKAGVIRCRHIEGGPQYSAYVNPSAIGPAADCRYLLRPAFRLKWQLLSRNSCLNSCLELQRMQGLRVI